jgi:hypothetical protein
MSGIGWPEFSVYVFCSLFALAVFIYMFMPVTDQDAGEQKTRLTYLYERKDVIYDNLRDLNFEHKSGKFSEADFESMRANMEAEAARVLAEIDKLESATA